jgi:hypothetical protein|nr:MAG TPA: protein of unknown function (DUF4494) [Caudoviricetes sp.]
MRSKTSTWFEAKVRYDKRLDDGQEKKVTEVFVVDALSFTEAETKITEEMSAYTSGEIFIKAITRATYSEVFFSDNTEDDKWYRTKLAFITLDENTGKEKKTFISYLVQAKNIDKARSYIKEVMNSTMNDYDVASISETPVLDIFEHKA